MEYYLAIDIGAASGRHIIGHLNNEKLVLEEIHRFENKLIRKDGELCWNLDLLFREIVTGMKKCKEIGRIPKSVGIDTWAVDFVLLDSENKPIGNAVAYRDRRTKGMDEVVYSAIPEDKLYARTGIQKQVFNTICQLMAIKERQPWKLRESRNMLMIPDYLHYLLSGVMKTEYTNATTTQLVSPQSRDWDRELIELLGFPREIFQQIIPPGTSLGNLRPEVHALVGFNCQVTVPATHDTASAVAAVPAAQESSVYISSGTWSLMGIERPEANCSPESRNYNFSNEGGYNYRFRYQKNIMGLWMVQCVQRELANFYSFPELCAMAEAESIASLVDCNDPRFFAPKSMIREIQSCCRETRQKEPVTAGELAAVIYNSLAHCYGNTLKEIEMLTGRTYAQIHIVGGGAQAEYLNKVTANHTGRKVLAGPVEAAAAGNIIAQMIHSRELKDITEARECLRNSLGIRTYDSQGGK